MNHLSRNIRVLYSKRKSFGIEIHPDQNILLRVPNNSNKSTIIKILKKNEDWIIEKLKKYTLDNQIGIPRKYLEGSTQLYMGSEYKLHFLESIKFQISLSKKDKRLNIFADTTLLNKSNVKTLLEKWYREQAKYVFQNRIDRFYKLMKKENIPYPTYKVKKLRSRWGSCSNKHNINLNLELIKFPIRLIDYVICHEMCHLKEQNHGYHFYNIVKRYIPDYKKREKEINLFSIRLNYVTVETNLTLGND